MVAAKIEILRAKEAEGRSLLERRPLDREGYAAWSDATREAVGDSLGTESPLFRELLAARRKVSVRYELDPSYHLTQIGANLRRELEVVRKCLAELEAAAGGPAGAATASPAAPRPARASSARAVPEKPRTAGAPRLVVYLEREGKCGRAVLAALEPWGARAVVGTESLFAFRDALREGEREGACAVVVAAGGGAGSGSEGRAGAACAAGFLAALLGPARVAVVGEEEGAALPAGSGILEVWIGDPDGWRPRVLAAFRSAGARLEETPTADARTGKRGSGESGGGRSGLSRRGFLAALAGTASAAVRTRRARASEGRDAPALVRAATSGPRFHFFGYYDKCPWDAAGRRLLAMEAEFCDRQPKPGETLALGTVDLGGGGEFVPFDATPAWSWQQGCMLQWLGPRADREVVYNVLFEGRYASVVRDLDGGATRRLPLPVYAVSRDGRQAVSLDFARLDRLRPGYGYCALPEARPEVRAPEDDGIWWMDLAGGAHRLIVPLAWAARHRPDERFGGAHHWFNHLQFNPSGTRFIFLHRFRAPGGTRWWTRLYTAKPDGTDIRLHADGGMVSHFDWRDDRTILAWARLPDPKDPAGAAKERFYLFDVESGSAEVFAEGVLTQDGHVSFSPDGRWVLSDTYPDAKRLQTLILYRVSDRRRVDVARFHAPERFQGPFRCDLHPRWNRDGTQVCIDSTHEGGRQIYTIDVRRIVEG